MNDFIKKVKEFHLTFKAPVLKEPQIPEDNRSNLRINLIQEELNELKEAIKNNDIVEAADACGDIMVVLCGTILEFGLADKFDEIFENIHNSNMSKACSSLEEADKTVKFYKETKNTDAHWNYYDGKYIVFRKSDNKVLKSINYKPANLEEIIKNK